MPVPREVRRLNAPFVRFVAACTLGTLLAMVVYDDATHAVGVVDDASDICAVDEDPCVIEDVFSVAPGSVLDFGPRQVRIVAGGRLDTGTGAVSLLCGTFETDVGAATAIEARAEDGFGGGVDGGSFTLVARRGCAGDVSRPCSDDTDCFAGACFASACAREPTIECATSSDCDFGRCAVGDGSVRLFGRIRAHGDTPGAVTIEAVGDVELLETVDVHATDPDGDGGTLSVISSAGSIAVEAPVDASAGRFSFGGEVTFDAAVDLAFGARVDVTGGEGDGGTLDATAGRDVSISAALDATAVILDGSGGEIAVLAGRDVQLAGGASLLADGHRSTDGFSGDGGFFTLDAGRDVSAEAGAMIIGRGSRPDADGGSLAITAGADVTFAGTVDVSGLGGDAGGGSIDVRGCTVVVAAPAQWTNRAEFATTRVLAGAALLVEAGASITTDADGENILGVAAGAPAPVVDGTVTPAPSIDLSAPVGSCLLCGNGTVDAGETCDDGGTSGGDGCSAGCQDEGCIDDTPGWPDAALCDDGQACTVGTCDTIANACVQQTACDDAVACTGDGCDAEGFCRNAPVDSACPDDSDPCTTARCDIVFGCIQVPIPSCRTTTSTTTTSTSTSSTTSGSVTTTTSTTSTSLPVGEDCGNGVVDPGEECDDGDREWAPGQACTAACRLLECGDADGSRRLTAVDSLFILRTAVSLEACDLCLCNVNGTTGPTSATHALRSLQNAVGIDVELVCPLCP